jgi:hypothetical protein
LNERTLIDPEAFALKFAQTAQTEAIADKDLAIAAKKFLLSYLTAYYLVDDFNAIERTNFKRVDEKKFQDLTFEELLNRVKSLNKY